MSRYIVIGAGAVGATFGAELHRAGHRVVLVARGAHLDALRTRGLMYRRPDGNHRLDIPAIAGPSEITLQPDDILVVATKSQDADGVLATWAWQPVAQQLPVLLLQNGLENARSALRRFATVLDAAVLIPSSYLTAGEVVSPAAPTVGVLYLGLAPRGEHEAAVRVAEDLRGAGFAVQVVADVERWKAGKLIGNIGYNLDALFAPSPLRDQLAAALREEARRILAAAGIDAADLKAESTIDVATMASRPVPGHERAGSSTFQSLARAGTSESDFLFGEVVLQARLIGLEAPLSAAVQQGLGELARDAGRPGVSDEAALRALLALEDRAAAPATVTAD